MDILPQSMDIVTIGGGPGGLYFSILMKKAFPKARIRVHERNKADDTFGWGVVFSDETLGGFQEADRETFDKITESFATWTDIDTFVGDAQVRSTGHGFCGLARKRLLEIFHERCRELDVELEFQSEVREEDFPDADLIVAADGIASAVREAHREDFRPTLDWRRCKFCWLGTTKPLEAFTFVFRDSPHGLFQVHAYPFQTGGRPLSTWIVECREEVWQAAGLEGADEEQTVRFVSELFADHLEGYELLTNKSIWRTFPTVRCETWHRGKTVLVGDAAHTAHFSIGSGTKLAMEDAIALVAAFQEHGTQDVPTVLAAYEDSRYVDGLKLQKAAQTSLEWFEESARYTSLDPLQFTFSLMSRSKRITYDNLALRDPVLVERVNEFWHEQQGAPREADGSSPPPMFAPFSLRELQLAGRLVVSPMCQYSAHDGVPGDWHLVHLGSLARGGAALVMAEMTNVTAQGRISLGCTGIWNDEQAAAWKRIVDFVHEHTAAKIGLQLGHAGRKGSCNLPWEGDDPLRGETAWETIGPGSEPFDENWPAPRALGREDMQRLIDDYAAATRRAAEAGFDLVEVHMAHGYLLSSFLSPLSNQRRDDYGGSLSGRLRFPLEVFDAVRAAFPAHRPVAVRISASDWLDDDGGQTLEDSVAIARALRDHGCDLVDVSSAGNSPRSEPVYGRMYQVPFAERIRREAGVPVMAVGGIQGADHVNTILAAGRADLCAIARGHLLDPHMTLRASETYAVRDQAWPRQYLAARRTTPTDR